MRAVVQERFGGPEVLTVGEVPVPQPGPREVLVRVHAAGVNPIDWHYLRGEPLIMRPGDAGVRVPKRQTLGFEIGGVVEQLGAEATRFAPGDAVWGWCTGGGFAEYVVVREERLVPKPGHLGFDEVAGVPVAGLTALQAVRDHGHVQPGQRVLVIGASGGVGTFAVQIANALGAQVTGVCSARNLDLVRSLGADHVIDYTTEDFVDSGRHYDVVLQVAGNRTFRDSLRVLHPTGVLVIVGGGEGEGRLLGQAKRFAAATFRSRVLRQGVHAFIGQVNEGDGLVLLDLLESGKMSTVIDRTYPLAETPAAIAYLETLRARGKVMVAVA